LRRILEKNKTGYLNVRNDDIPHDDYYQPENWNRISDRLSLGPKVARVNW